MHSKYFEVYGHCERDIQCFMSALQATDRNIEPTCKQFVYNGSIPSESAYVGFGYVAQITHKRLLRSAEFHKLQLVFAQPALSD